MSIVAGTLVAMTLGLTAAGVAEPSVQSPVAQPAPAAEVAAGKLFKRTELYFGSRKPDGSEVRPEEFDNFVDKEVTPAFPAGLTQLTGKGQFRGASGEIVKERSYVLILFYPTDARDAHRQIEEIREDYKRFFQQESVLRADSTDRVSF